MGDKKILQRVKDVGVILFWKNKITASLIYSSFVMWLVVVAGLFLLVRREQGVLIGHYNAFFGIDVLINTNDRAELWELFLPVLGGFFFLLVSVLMSFFFILQLDRTAVDLKEPKDSLVSNRAISFVGSRLLLIGAWLVQLVMIVYLIAIWLIN